MEENPGGLLIDQTKVDVSGFEGGSNRISALGMQSDPIPTPSREAVKTRYRRSRLRYPRHIHVWQGMWNNWAGTLATAVMDLAAQRHMRVGYLYSTALLTNM